MDDTISRQAAIETFDCTDELIASGAANAQNVVNYINKVVGKIKDLPSAQSEIIRCKDCIHKPKPTEDYKQGERDSGFKIEFPDYMCPLQCEDPYYSRLPKDDWFCGNAERRTDERSD